MHHSTYVRCGRHRRQSQKSTTSQTFRLLKTINSAAKATWDTVFLAGEKSFLKTTFDRNITNAGALPKALKRGSPKERVFFFLEATFKILTHKSRPSLSSYFVLYRGVYSKTTAGSRHGGKQFLSQFPSPSGTRHGSLTTTAGVKAVILSKLPLF